MPGAAPILRGITWAEPRGYDPMVASARAYAETHPEVAIHWEKRSLQAFADQSIEDLAAAYDLMIIDHPHMGVAARSGCLLPFDGLGRDDELVALDRHSVGASYVSYRWQGHQWALPVDAAAQVAAFRPDLLTRPPATWDAVLELAREGQVLWPAKPVDALMSFYTLAANVGRPCASQPGRFIAGGDGLTVLSALRELGRHVPRACLTMNPPGALEWLSRRDDKSYCPLLYGYSNYARDGFRPRLVEFADIPALGQDGPRGACLGGAGIAVSRLGRHAGTAVDYALWVAAESCQRGIYFQSGGQPAHAAAWDDPGVNAASHGFFRATRTTLERSWLRPRYDGYLSFQDQGGDILNEFLARELDPATTLARLEAAYRASQSS